VQRRGFVLITLLSLAGWRGAAAQLKVSRLGFLWTSNPEAEYLEAFRAGLRELGYAEGRNFVLQQRSAANVVSRLDSLARELIAEKVDVVVTQGAPAARALAGASDTVPIVVALGQPLNARLVKSLSRPGGNVTGLTVLATELSSKRLELLKQVNPKLSRVALLVDATATDPDGAPIVGPRALEAAARSLGVQVQVLSVRGPNDFAAAYAAASEARAEAMILSPSPVLTFHNKALVDLAAKHRMPAIYGNPESVKLGGFMSYGPSYTELFRRAATYVDRILKGARPADLPIEQPTKFELAINLGTAKALGVTIPPGLLLRADRVLQ
jgi:putative ABC transport system substrate-binding protein